MTLLVDIMNESWMSPREFGREIQDLDPELVRFYPDIGDPSDITMLATDRLRPGLVAQLNDLKLIQKLGVGVDTMVKDPELRDYTACDAAVEACGNSEDYIEGYNAFLEKRKPQFAGR